MFQTDFRDGDAVKKGDVIGTVTGNIQVLLSGERTALNYLQRMSGIATFTREMVQELSEMCIRDSIKRLVILHAG